MKAGQIYGWFTHGSLHFFSGKYHSLLPTTMTTLLAFKSLYYGFSSLS